MESNELPGMPPKEKIASLIEVYAEQTDDINKRRSIRRDTKNQIIKEMRALKKGELKIDSCGFRYTFRIVPGDANLLVSTTPIKATNL